MAAMRAQRKDVAFAGKESRRWLDGAQAACGLKTAGAICVTIIAGREGGIHEDFALRPQGTELVIRAGQDRRLCDGTRLFGCLAAIPEAGRMMIDLAGLPVERHVCGHRPALSRGRDCLSAEP